jgi:6-phosphogluconolactonase
MQLNSRLSRGQGKSVFAYVGTQSKASLGGVFGGLGDGVYAFEVNVDDGSLKQIDVAPLADPGFLTVARTKRVLYASSHVNRFEGEPGGGVTALSIGADGRLARLNAQRVRHPHVTQVSLDRAERYVLAASSLGGGVTALSLASDGSIAAVADEAQFEGELVIAPGETPEPQPIPGMPGRTIPRMPRFGPTTMIHCVLADLTNQYLLAADFGHGGIGVLGFDAHTGRFTSRRRFELGREAGPRTMALHPNGSNFYTSNERESAVGVYSFDAFTGAVEELQSVCSLPAGVPTDKNTASGIAVHPSGHFVYSTNRGHDSIAVFAVGDGGLLEFMGTQSAQSQFPMHLALTPDGRLLYAACLTSGAVSAFGIDDGGARLTPLQVTKVPSAMCTALFDESEAAS